MQKSIRQNSTFIMVIIHNKLGAEWTYLNIIKANYDKFTDGIILNAERLKAFFLKSQAKQEYPFSHDNRPRLHNKENFQKIRKNKG